MVSDSYSPAVKRSKSARKDANRKAKLLDLSNWLVLYLEPSDIVFWHNAIGFPDGAGVGSYGTGAGFVDNSRTVLKYNSVKSSAICAGNKLGYTRFKKGGLPVKDRDHYLSDAWAYDCRHYTQYGERVTWAAPSLVRVFGGKEGAPRRIMHYDRLSDAYLIGLAVFDPDHTFLGY